MDKYPTTTKELLDMFTHFCSLHPELRFWQALSSWSSYEIMLGDNGKVHDPFYWENNWKDWPRG